MNKAEVYVWACGILRDAMESKNYGTLTFSMQNGIIGNVKKETVSKPPVDTESKQP